MTSAAARPYQSVFTRWWFGHALLFAMSSAILLLAVLMRPDPDVLTLFGEPIPMMCSFRRITGYGCPGCGMTRAFVYMAHGQVLEAFRMNPVGPPFFAFILSQVPWQGWRLVSGWRKRRAP